MACMQRRNLLRSGCFLQSHEIQDGTPENEATPDIAPPSGLRYNSFPSTPVAPALIEMASHIVNIKHYWLDRIHPVPDRLLLGPGRVHSTHGLVRRMHPCPCPGSNLSGHACSMYMNDSEALT